MSNYYIPEIEEFCIGFEYEIAIIDNYWNLSGFKKETVDQNFDFNTLIKYPKLYKVKYLDKEDLLDLGFKLINEKDGYQSFEYSEDNILYLQYFEDGKGWYLSYSENESQFGFAGWVKNKSELKKLMKQMNLYESL